MPLGFNSIENTAKIYVLSSPQEHMSVSNEMQSKIEMWLNVLLFLES